MPKRSLVQTNPYLRDPGIRRKIFMITVYTSTRVEGVRLELTDLAPSLPVSPQPARVPRAGLAYPIQKQRRIRT